LTDTGSIPGMISSAAVDVALYFLTFLIVGGILLSYHWQMALLCFTLIPVHIVILILFHRPVRKWSMLLRAEGESVSGDVVEHFSGIRLIRSLGTEEGEQKRLADRLDTLRNWSVRSSLLGKSSSMASNVIANFWSFFVLWYGGHQVISGQLTAGQLIAFLMLLLRMLAPVSGITYLLLGFQDTIVGIARVYEVLDTKPEILEAEHPVKLEHVEGKLEFRNIYFEYEPGQPVIRGVNFTIEPGRTVALVGRSGAGKTTLASLAARFYDPTEGEILLDDINLKNIRIKQLRKSVAVVLQEDFLFSGTIHENLTARERNIPDEKVLQAARTARVDEFAERPGYPAGSGKGLPWHGRCCVILKY